MRTLNDRVAVVTGAASGIGRATARALSAAGCRLALVDVQEAPLLALAAELPGASAHRVDVADREAMAGLPAQVLAHHGAVHVLVNNAGVTVARPFTAHSLEDWDWVLGVNLRGVVHGCHFFLPHLLQAEEAHIVNLSSLFGIVAVPGQAAYCTSKFAVRGLTETLWEELADTRVGVTVVHPGGINTGIVANARGDDEEQMARLRRFFEKATQPPERVAQAIVRAILRGERRVRVTREAVVGDWLKRVLPELGNQVAVRVMSRAMGLRRPPALPGPR